MAAIVIDKRFLEGIETSTKIEYYYHIQRGCKKELTMCFVYRLKLFSLRNVSF